MQIQHFLSPFLILNVLFGYQWFVRATLDSLNNVSLTPASLLHIDVRQTHVVYVENTQNSTIYFYDRTNPANTYSVNLAYEIIRILSHDSNTLQAHNFLVEIQMAPSQSELRLYSSNFTSFSHLKTINSPDVLRKVINLDKSYEFCYEFYDQSLLTFCIWSSYLGGEICFLNPITSMVYGYNNRIYILH